MYRFLQASWQIYFLRVAGRLTIFVMTINHFEQLYSQLLVIRSLTVVHNFKNLRPKYFPQITVLYTINLTALSENVLPKKCLNVINPQYSTEPEQGAPERAHAIV